MTVFHRPWTLVFGLLYLAIVLAIGVWAMRRTRTAADFFIAGKSIGVWALALASFSSIQSGFGLVGGGAQVYNLGNSFLWALWSAPLGFVLTWFVLGKRLRALADAREVYTLPDAVAARYGSDGARFWTAVALLLGVMGYLGTQVQATGVIMNVVFGTGYVTGLIIGLGVLAAYTIIGGMVAGVYTDVFQGAIMVLASIAIFIYVLVNGGGFLNIQQQLVAADPRMVSPWGLVPALTCLSWFFLFAVGSSGQPQFLHKFYMSKGIETLRWGGLLAGLAYMMTTFLAMGLGMGMRALVQSGAAPALKSPDQAVPTYLLHYTPDVLAGVVFAGLLAAIMSTGDAFVNIGAACIVRDIPRSFGRKVRNELLWGRVWTLVLFLVSTAFALYMNTLVALLGTFGWATFAAALVPVLGIGLSWRRATAPAAIVTLIVSLALNFGLELLSRYKIYRLPHGMVNGALILAVSVVLFVVLSVLTRPRELEPDVAAALDA